MESTFFSTEQEKKTVLSIELVQAHLPFSFGPILKDRICSLEGAYSPFEKESLISK